MSLANTVEFYNLEDDTVTLGPPLPFTTLLGWAYTIEDRVHYIPTNRKEIMVLRGDLSGWEAHPRQLPNNKAITNSALYFV